MLMEDLGGEPCVGSQVFQDPVLPAWLTFLLLTRSFSINLGSNSSNLAFHFSPRFNESVIVCNSRCSKAWQSEHRDKHLCFSKGSTVKVRGLCRHGGVGCVWWRKPLVGRFLYPSPPSAIQCFLLPPNNPSSSGFLVLIAISIPRSNPEHFLWELCLSSVCLRLCKCFLPPRTAQQVSTLGACMKVKGFSKRLDLAALYPVSFPNSLLQKHRLSDNSGLQAMSKNLSLSSSVLTTPGSMLPISSPSPPARDAVLVAVSPHLMS